VLRFVIEMTSTAISGKHCRIHFRVRCEAMLGQDVGVSGNISVLGNFEKSKFYRLYTTPESYPVWTSVDPILVPIGQVLSYKYCLVEIGEFKTYEKCENRIFIPEKTDNFVEDHFIIEEIEVSRDSELELFQEMKVLTATPTEESKVDLTEIATGSRLIIVCYHLPVLVKRNIGNAAEPFTITWAESLIAKSSNNSVSSSFDTHWMGTMSVPGEAPNEDEMKFLLKALNDMNCHPIFVDSELANKAYHGFCKLIMWPIFHNVDQMDQIHAGWKLFPPDGRTHPESPRDDQSVLDWNSDIHELEDAYFDLNRIFAKELDNWLHLGDTVWVHDYHLMALPQMVRNLGRNAKLVFFLHIPFPTSQIFRSLPAATPLLQSMAAADVVGFHTFDHARHFLTAMKRILGIRSHTKQGGILVLDVQDREVIVTVSHVSVEVHDIDRVLANPDTWSNANEIKNMCANRKIIIGLDVGQRLSGGVLKLAAYEKFLTDNPKEVNKTVLIQKMVRSSSRQGDEMTTSVDMKEMVERINGKFSITREDGTHLPAVIYEEIALRSATLADRITLWLASDVFLLTPIKEGLNLYPLEFIYAHEARARRDGQGQGSGMNPSNGVVIASEFSTCSSLLNGALKINPYFTLTVADTIHKALYMPTTEAHQRRQRDLNFISSHPSSLWTKEILSDLRHVENRDKRNLTKSNHMVCYPDPLPVDDLLKSFYDACHSSQYGISDSSSRLFIFDYGGTLLNKERSDIYIKQSLSAISGRSPSGMLLCCSNFSSYRH
jgi:trehalose 6-phosphate synthase/phosphatase